MRPVNYKGAFSPKKRKAVAAFVRRVREQVSLPDHPQAVSGPGGQVLVLCSVGHKGATERSVRRAMSKASQEVLTKQGVWVVGLPSSKPKASVNIRHQTKP